jgi:hypothetical protein
MIEQAPLHQRLLDLVRYCRHRLFDVELITREEFAELVKDHPAVARLSSYDELRAELTALQKGGLPAPRLACEACNVTGKVNEKRCRVCHGEAITYVVYQNLVDYLGTINLNVPEPYRQPQLDLSMIRMRDALTSHAEQPQSPTLPTWEPIETAPQGKTILTWAIVDTETGNWNTRTSHYVESPSGVLDSHWHGWPSYCLPTHWMPLPSPPAIARIPKEQPHA